MQVPATPAGQAILTPVVQKTASSYLNPAAAGLPFAEPIVPVSAAGAAATGSEVPEHVTSLASGESSSASRSAWPVRYVVLSACGMVALLVCAFLGIRIFQSPSSEPTIDTPENRAAPRTRVEKLVAKHLRDTAHDPKSLVFETWGPHASVKTWGFEPQKKWPDAQKWEWLVRVCYRANNKFGAKEYSDAIFVVKNDDSVMLLEPSDGGIIMTQVREWKDQLDKWKDDFASKLITAITQARTITQALESYKRDHSLYPGQLTELLQVSAIGKGPYLKSVDNIRDPWGREFQYDPSGNYNLKQGAVGIPDVYCDLGDGRVIGNWTKRQ